MRTYITLDHDVLNLSDLDEAGWARFESAYAAYSDKMDYWDFLRGPGSWGYVNRTTYDSPLYRAVQDLEFRIGIRCGTVGPEEGDDWELDPLRDSAVSVADAATSKGVTVRAVHKAIERGELVADGRPAQVSAESLLRWKVSAGRQRAGRLSHGAA